MFGLKTDTFLFNLKKKTKKKPYKLCSFLLLKDLSACPLQNDAPFPSMGCPVQNATVLSSCLLTTPGAVKTTLDLELYFEVSNKLQKSRLNTLPPMLLMRNYLLETFLLP